MMPRMGIGIDMHRLAPDRPLILGGVRVPYDRGLEGHSDADVLTHAIVDALLGALALGNIGTHFPSSDPRWKDVDSGVFLDHALGLVADRGYRVGNVDATLVAQVPRLSPHLPEIRRRLADRLGTALDAVSVKATTAEMMGALGREEGIACMAVALLAPRGGDDARETDER